MAITRSQFGNITGRVLAADSETDDLGRYNVEQLRVTDSHFDGVQGHLVTLYRGGSDESTFGPRLLFAGNQVANAGARPLAGDPSVMNLVGVQEILITANTFTRAAPIRILHTTGSPVTRIEGNTGSDTPAPVITSARADLTPQQVIENNSFSGGVQ